MFWAWADSEGALPFIQAATLLVVSWYAWQTAALTNEMKRQTGRMEKSLELEKRKARVAAAVEASRHDPIIEIVGPIVGDPVNGRIILANMGETVTYCRFRSWCDEGPWLLPHDIVVDEWVTGSRKNIDVPEAAHAELNMCLELQFMNLVNQQRRIQYRIRQNQITIVRTFTSGELDLVASDVAKEDTEPE